MTEQGRSFRRAVARRVFAFELNEATYRLESDDKTIHLSEDFNRTLWRAC